MLDARIHINQIGYQPNQPKTVVVANATDARTFELVSAEGHVVFSGELVARGFDEDSGDSLAHGDFSAFTQSGRYFVRVPHVGESYPFTVGATAYAEVLKLAARWFYLQRSGAAKNDPVTNFAHPADHLAPAFLWDTDGQHPDQTFEVSGGWWDAGDYGRYVPPAATTIMALLYAWRFNPSFFHDGSLNIPESGNGQSDLLDELRWELNWLLKMQRADGAFHHKVTNTGFAGEVMPEAVTLPLYLYSVSTWATAQAAGALAEASLAFRSTDPAFADTLLSAAQKAWTWLTANLEPFPVSGFTNPEHSGGPYSLSGRDETEYRLWAAASLLHATDDPAYAKDFAKLWANRDRSQQVYSLYWWGGYAFACLAYLDSPAGDPFLKSEILSVLTKQGSVILEVIGRTGYNVALAGRFGEFGYDWGSNAINLGHALWLLLINQYAPNHQQVSGAAAQLNYVLGVNPLNKCYFTGAGGNPVHHPHHRPSLVLGHALPGMVGEGANGMNVGGDRILQALFDSHTPPARCYADHNDSWATNEPTIYGNALFVAVAAWFARTDSH
jgi:endoglucanase